MNLNSNSKEIVLLKQKLEENPEAHLFEVDDLGQVTFDGVDGKKLAEYSRILFLDLDITCHDKTTGHLDSKLLSWLSELQEKKILLVVPTTGRPFASPKFLAMDFKLKPTVLIATNGTTVAYPHTNGRTIIERSDCQGVLYDVLTVLSQEQGLKYTPLWSNSEATDINLASAQVDVAALRKVINNHEAISRIVKPFGGLEITQSGGKAIHLHLKKNSKGAAVELLLRKAGIDKSRTIYAGNGLNDVSARPFVGHMLTVANAQVEMKDVADYVSPLDSSEGTREGLCKYLRENNLLS